jgi:hypothetical protein
VTNKIKRYPIGDKLNAIGPTIFGLLIIVFSVIKPEKYGDVGVWVGLNAILVGYAHLRINEMNNSQVETSDPTPPEDQ